MSDNEQTIQPSMQEAMEKADKDLGGSDKPEKVSRGTERDVRETQQVVAETQQEWKDAPKYTAKWKPEARKALEAFALNPDNADNWKHLQEQLGEVHSLIGRQGNRIGQLEPLERRYGPLNDMLSQAEQRYQMQGQSLQQGIGQLFAVSDALAQNPDQTLPWIGSLYKPRDPARAITAMAQQWGVDLGQVAQGQPYIDPAITGIVGPLMNRLQSLESGISQQQQYAAMQQQNQLVAAVTAFENAADENGKPKHPYFRDVFPGMMYAINSGQAQNIDQAYAWAVRYHEPAIQEKAKAAEAAALAEAARTTNVTNQARAASSNLNGTAARGRQNAAKPSMQEAMRMADKQLGFSSS